MQKNPNSVKVEEWKKIKVNRCILLPMCVIQFYVLCQQYPQKNMIFFVVASFTLIMPLTKGSRNNSYDLLIFSKPACCNTAFEVFPCLIKYLLFHPVLSLYGYVVFQSLSTAALWGLDVLTFCANKMNLWACREFFFKCKNGFENNQTGIITTMCKLASM